MTTRSERPAPPWSTKVEQRWSNPILLHLHHFGGAKWSKVTLPICSTSTPLIRGGEWSGAGGEVENKVEQMGAVGMKISIWGGACVAMS